MSAVLGPNNPPPRKEVKMYATDMAVSTDTEMTSAAGLSDRRIFICGSLRIAVYTSCTINRANHGLRNECI